MDNWFEFVLERYNYWIVIALMMTGLYIVFARGNLVKKVVGLNVFQTSVFIFYITMGKIAGGTAPIYMGGELDHGDGHGDGPGESEVHGGDELAKDALAHSADHPSGHGGEASHSAAPDSLPSADDFAAAAGLHSTEGLASKIDNSALVNNDIKAAAKSLKKDAAPPDVPNLHLEPEGAAKIANDALMGAPKPGDADFAFDSAQPHADALVGTAGEALHHAGEVIYTNPLPHVLILTAIVVGVATTAVGLALAVRIREAYGTIEEDELEALDNVAEFGAPEEAGAAA